MANALLVLPDSILCVLQYLRARSEVTTLCPSAQIETAFPSSPTNPYVLITLAGGPMIWPALDNAAIQIDCYAADKVGALTLARTVRAAMAAINNDIVAAGVLTHAVEEQAPQWFLDPVTVPPRPRYVQRHRILIHP